MTKKMPKIHNDVIEWSGARCSCGYEIKGNDTKGILMRIKLHKKTCGSVEQAPVHVQTNGVENRNHAFNRVLALNLLP
jgi:hypothetical protein